MPRHLLDDRGIAEETLSLPALAIVVIGLAVYVGLVAESVSSVDDAQERRQVTVTADQVAQILATDSFLQSQGSGDALDRDRIEAAVDDPTLVFRDLSLHPYDAQILVRTWHCPAQEAMEDCQDGLIPKTWTIGPADGEETPDTYVGDVQPVPVRWDTGHTFAGELELRMWYR